MLESTNLHLPPKEVIRVTLSNQQVAKPRSVTAAELAAMSAEEKADWQQACYLERTANQVAGSNSDPDLIEGAC